MDVELVVDLLLSIPKYLVDMSNNLFTFLLYPITIGDVTIRVMDILIATGLAIWIIATIIKAIAA